ncbi:hypothetical protein M407DRAFT_241209 [Tulasnella calospora MUT 4182]|uniref:ER membrane protein complex subunit 4 n=1 Tax=Tulasnella calospora MUT 4182 TaxID=1051891 RepID=A0A0C3MGY3_9AGAM|nr:hypothetical protein M407DRAFT_241209 [Tulasnella calospora MUT 4182]
MPYSLDYRSLDSTYPKSEKLPRPPNFEKTAKATDHTSSPTSVELKAANHAQIKEKRAWDLAISPAKSLPMNGFMLYMSGNSLQIFSIGILVMLLMNPFKAVANINRAFSPFAPANSNPTALDTLAFYKLVYVACNLLTLGLGLWKCSKLGILPTANDWRAFSNPDPVYVNRDIVL